MFKYSPPKDCWEKKVQYNRSKAYKQVQTLQTEVVSLKRKLWTARKQVSRIKGSKELTPRSKIKRLARGKNLNPDIKRRLFFNEVLCSQIKDSAQAKSDKAKQIFHRMLSGKLIKKYKMMNRLKHILSLRRMRKAHTSFAGIPSHEYKRQTKVQRVTNVRKIEQFFLRDDISTACPDAKGFVYKFGTNKIKKKEKGS